MIEQLICIAVLTLVFAALRWLTRERKTADKLIKQLGHDHDKNVPATLLDPKHIPGEDLDIFECQHPHIEYRAGCN